jgi:hypothetical protein
MGTAFHGRNPVAGPEGLFATGTSGVVQKVEMWFNSSSGCETLQEFWRDERPARAA